MTTRYYFYLSYGHSVRLRADDRPDTDYWAGQLFEELSDEVSRLVDAEPGTPVGYYDDLVGAISDWKATLTGVLSATDVFVALYSPGYFNKSWPLRERAAFAGRFAGEGSERFLLPVLWVPWPRWEHEAERGAALRLGAGVPEYAEEGLQAMARLEMYRRQYRTVVRRMARQIVTAAAEAPRTGPPAVAIDEVEVEPTGSTEIQFTVVVLGGHARPPRSWNPYAGVQRFPIAEYVANVAERLGQPARIADRPTDLGRLGDGAVVVLVDPALAGTTAGRRRLRDLAKRLPDWATVLLIADQEDPRDAVRGAGRYEAVTATLTAAGVATSRITLVVDADRLVDRLPSIIDNACTAYRKNAPVFLPKGADSALPRIAGGEGSHA
ncbi:MAG TPA: hypothetical protein VGD29_06870 [Actinoplanes sp.]